MATKRKHRRPAQQTEAQPAPSLHDALASVMIDAIDSDRIEHGRPDKKSYTREEVHNAVATVAAMAVLACPFSGRGVILREASRLVDRILKE